MKPLPVECVPKLRISPVMTNAIYSADIQAKEAV